MHDDLTPLRVLRFYRDDANGRVWCSIALFDDSAYIKGTDMEVVVEWCSNPLEVAIEHVQRKGYLRSSDS